MSNFAPSILAMQLRTKTRLDGESKSEFIDRLLREREDAADCIEELYHRVVKLEYRLDDTFDVLTGVKIQDGVLVSADGKQILGVAVSKPHEVG